MQYTTLLERQDLSEIEKQNISVVHRKNFIGKLLFCFSPAHNFAQIFNPSVSPKTDLRLLEGVRVLSMAWVLLSYCYAFIQFIPLNNILTIDELYEASLFGVVPGGLFGIDTFLFCSGLITAFMLASKIFRKDNVCYWKMYFHKYYRMIFNIMISQGIIICLFKYMGDGPVYKKAWVPLTQNCDKYWLTNILLISNYIPWGMYDS